MRYSILLVMLALTLCACQSKARPDLLPNDGSAWNHNYVIINPVVQPEGAATKPVYPPCPDASQPQVPQMGVQPKDCWPPAAKRTSDNCKDGVCEVPLQLASYGPEDEPRPLTLAEDPLLHSRVPPPATATEKHQPPVSVFVVFGVLGLLLGMAAASQRMHWGVRVGAGILLALGAVTFLTGCSGLPFESDPFVRQSDLDGGMSAISKTVEGGGLALEGILGMMGGGGVLGAALVRLLRGTSLRSGSGRKTLAAKAAEKKVEERDKERASEQVA